MSSSSSTQQQAATTASTSYSPSTSSSQPASAYVGPVPPAAAAAAASGGGGEHVSRVSSSRLSATYDYANNRSADKSSSSSPGLRRWSRNLSEQRHRELDRLNQIERRRQFLELKRQNDLFDQMSAPSTSAVVSGGRTTVVVQNQEGQQAASSSSASAAAAAVRKGTNSSSSADETKATTLSENQAATKPKSGQQLGASKEASPQSVIAERNDSDKPATAAATSIGNGLLDCDPVVGKTAVTCSAETSLTWSSSVEADERTHKGSSNNSERALAHTNQVSLSGNLQPESGYQVTVLQVAKDSMRSTDNDCAEIENPTDKPKPNGDLIQQSEQAFLAHHRRPISTEQLAQFVHTRVPENKRVLCLIIRDKMSRLSKAKSYFYPTYYLFIQAIVDIDDSYGGSCGYGNSSNGECSLLGARGSDEDEDGEGEGEGDQSGSSSRVQLAADVAGESRGESRAETNASVAASADNSFSASSSISADMLFIGGNNNNISGGAQSGGDNLNGFNSTSSSQAAICHSPPLAALAPGTSYSDNEVYADTETEEGASTMAATAIVDVCDKKAKKVVKRGSLLMMAGNSLRGRDSPLVFPNNSKRDINTQCSSGATNYDASEASGLIDGKKKALVYPPQPLNQSSGGGGEGDKSKHSSVGGTSKSATPGRRGRTKSRKSLAKKRPNLPPPKGGRQKDLDVGSDSDVNDDGSRQKQHQSRRLLNDDDDEEEEEEEEEEDDDDDQVGALSRNTKSGRVANNNNSDDEDDDDDDEEVDYKFQSGSTGAMVELANHQQMQVVKKEKKNYCDQLQQDLFDNDQNPYTGTYGVLLAGRRRKKAKT